MKNSVPRGTQDLLEDQIYQWQKLEDMLRKLCRVYNFDEIRTPTFEHTSVFLRENDSSDMVNKEMYTFTLPNSKESLTLRPEGTAGVVRSYVENKAYASADLPKKYYYMGPMHRHERPQKGRLRIFNQFGVESLGLKSPWVDAETIVLGYSILKSLGLDQVKVLINTLGDAASRQKYKEALQEYFKDHLDELCVDCKRRYTQNPLRILDCKVDHENPLLQNAPKISDYLTQESKDYFEKVLSLLDQFEIPYEIDPGLVRGLDYYTDTVFEMVQQKPGLDQLTLLAGGRYDSLIRESGGPDQSGIGFALGMERILLALKDAGIVLDEKPSLDAYVIVLSDQARDYALDVLTKLRKDGLRSDMDMMERSLKGQFKASDRAKARFLVLVGDQEMKEQKVSLKDTRDRSQISIPLKELNETIRTRLYEGLQES